MSVTCLPIRQLISQNTDVLDAKLIYPNLVIFEDHHSFRITELNKREESESTDVEFKYEHQIVDKTLQDNLLWVLLKTGEIIVIDVHKGTQIKITVENFTKYEINRLQSVEEKLFLTSKSGECLYAPVTVMELDKKMNEGEKEISVTLEKARLRYADLVYHSNKQIVDGLNFIINKGQLTAECPLTGLREVIMTNVDIEHMIPWGETVVLSSKMNMWAVDIKNSNVSFTFENKGQGNYYPLTVHNNGFYYLVWDKNEVQICCAWNASLPAEEIEAPSSKSKQSSQEVLKSQLQALIEAALGSKDSSQILLKLKPYFEKIDDLPFLIESTIKLCQHDLTYKPILHLLQKKAFPSSDEEIMNQINDLIIKVDLLEFICFRGNNSYEEVNLFNQNYRELLVIFISKSDLDLASICWLKYSEMNLEITSSDVLEILSSIPQNIKMGALLIWLRNFIPPLLDNNPYFIDLFVEWTIQRLFSLEKSSYWPKIGLKFIDEITNVLGSSMKTLSIRPISMDSLDTLKDHICYIMELKEKYKITILLGEISSQSPSEVAIIMLRRCYTEDLDLFLQNFLPSYATRYLLEMDDVLSTFIKNEAASCGGSFDGSRLKILLGAFHLHATKLDCLLQVLKVIDVPWDDNVLGLAVTAASSVLKDFTVTDSDRILAHEIQKELNYATVKVVLKKYNFPLNFTDYSVVLYQLINAPSVDLNDLKVITNVLDSHLYCGHVLYIDRCLRNCETTAALNFFSDLTKKEKTVVLKTIVARYEQIIKGNTSSPLLERNYLDFSKGTKFLTQIQIDNIENLYHLKNSYGMPMDINTMYNETICRKQTVARINTDGVTASSARGRCISQLTRTHQSRHSELLYLLSHASTSNKVRKLIECLLTALTNDEESAANDIAAVLKVFKEDKNSTLLVESYNVLIELVTNCSEEYLHDLLRYLSVLNALINSNITVKNLAVAWKFNYIFLPMSSMTAIDELISFYTSSLVDNDWNRSLLNSQNKNDVITFRMLATVPPDETLSEETLEIKYNAATRLIAKVVTCQELDELLLTNLLLILSTAEVSENRTWVLDMLQGQNDSMPLPIIQYLSTPVIVKVFALESVLSGNAVSYSPQHILKSKFNINLSDAALSDSTEETWDVKVVLFYVLRQYPATTFERLVELCSTLNISVNDGLSLQLIALLTTWELKYKINIDDLGCRKMYFENSEKELMTRCFTIWDSVHDKGFLKNILNEFWKNGEATLHGRAISINPYYYEIYICVFHLLFGSTIEMRNKREYFLLNFLKEYTRKSTPKQYEFELFSVKGIFPEIGHYRLPFQLFMREDMWSNLKSEITLETYERWLIAVSLLALDPDSQTAKDMICSNAVKQTMTARKRNGKTDEDCKEDIWQLMSKEEPLLRAAHRCLRHITNMDWAGACLFYVLQGVARGADQVIAAQLSYQFAQRWVALQPGNRAARQMERLHFTLSTRHALHKIEWACEEFVRLVAEPTQLIRALYLHPNFVEKMARHDVNRVADEIADKNGINISSIRFQILENILSKLNQDKTNDACVLDTRDVMTAKYILKATCPKMGAIYLSRIAFDDESDFNKCKKLRALQCLMSVVDGDTALKVANKDRDALWPLLLDLLYTVHLEIIDLPWLVATYAQDKTQALHQLLQTVSGNVEGLKIAADLARRYGSVQHIRELLPLMLRAGLYEEMIPPLLKLSTPPDDVIYTAWRAVILTPFQRADYPITEDHRAKCLNAINLLPLCPVIKDDDLIEVWKNCVRCKCIGMGCLVLPYISAEKRQSLVELQKIDRRKLIASLKNLQTESYLVSGAMLVVESLSSRTYR